MGCFIFILITYNPLKQSVNMYAGLLGVFFVNYFAINSALKMFCRPGSLIATSIFLD